jgi:hypothetical protein
MANGFLPTNTGIGAIPPEVLQDQQAVARQQRMAQMLMQQGMQQPQGQMVGGRYVPPSIFQNLAGLANVYVGTKMEEQADKRQLEMAQRLREGEQKSVQEYMNAMRGTPEQQTQMAGPFTGDVPPPVLTQPATGPNYQRALEVATNPYAPTWLKQQATDMLKTQKLGAEESLVQIDPATGQPRVLAQGMGKLRAPVQVDTGTMIEFRDALDPTKVLARIPKTQAPSAGKDFGNALSLRKEFNSEPIYKGYQEVKNAWNQINTGLNSASPAGDLAAATKFMKLLDPTSVVRESELLMAMQASGALDRLYNYAQMRVSGNKLTPTQRDDFRKLSDEFYKTSLSQFNDKFNEYRDIAVRNNLNPEDIGKPEVFKPAAAPKKDEKPKAAVGEQLNVPRINAPNKPKFLGFE